MGEGVVHWRVGDPRGCKPGDPRLASLPSCLCCPWAAGGSRRRAPSVGASVPGTFGDLAPGNKGDLGGGRV